MYAVKSGNIAVLNIFLDRETDITEVAKVKSIHMALKEYLLGYDFSIAERGVNTGPSCTASFHKHVWH